MKKNKAMLRFTTRDRGLETVDLENDVIFGAKVISIGMAEGHGVEIDKRTLEQVADLGNKIKGGVKSRFGHPNASSTSLGTFLGRAKNFRLDGESVRADIHLDATSHETPSGDLGGYVMKLAQSDPDAFGTSIVFRGDEEVRLNPDGTRQKDEDGDPLPPLARVEVLKAVDVVDTPAANRGLFDEPGPSPFTPDLELSAAATEFMDDFLGRPEAVDKVISFLSRYGSNKEASMSKTEETRAGEANPVEKTTPAAAGPSEPGQFFSAADVRKIVGEAVSGSLREERSRVASLRESAFPGQETLLQQAIDEGWDVPKAQAAFIKAKKESDATKLSAIRKDDIPDLGVGGGAPAGGSATSFDDGDVSEEGLKARWEASPEDRKEFGSFSAFSAYRRAVASGRINEGRLKQVDARVAERLATIKS